MRSKVLIAPRAGLGVPPLAFPVLACLLWAGNFAVGRAVHTLVPPIALNFWRWAIALMILLPLAAPEIRRSWPALMRSWRLVLVLAVLGVTLFNTVLYTGLQTTRTTNASILFAATPLLITLVSQRIYGGEAFLRRLGGLLLSFAGVIL